MFSRIALCLFLFAGANMYAQTDTKTPAHQNIKGTAVWLIPPPGFQPSPNFKGFMDPASQTSMIMLTEMPAPYTEIIKPFVSTGPLPNNLVVKRKKDLQVAKMKALLITAEQAAAGNVFEKHLLVFGDSLKTIIVNGVSLQDSAAMGQAIEKALATVYYDDQQVIDTRGMLDYALNETGTKLKFSTVVGNSMLFSVDGKTPTQSADKTAFFVDKSYAAVEIPNQKDFCINRLRKLPYAKTELNENRGIKAIKIDGLNGFDLLAKAYKKEDSAPEYIYQAILFGEKGYFLLIGIYEENTPENVATVEKLAKTFRRN